MLVIFKSGLLLISNQGETNMARVDIIKIAETVANLIKMYHYEKCNTLIKVEHREGNDEELNKFFTPKPILVTKNYLISISGRRILNTSFYNKLIFELNRRGISASYCVDVWGDLRCCVIIDSNDCVRISELVYN